MGECPSVESGTLCEVGLSAFCCLGHGSPDWKKFGVKGRAQKENVWTIIGMPLTELLTERERARE